MKRLIIHISNASPDADEVKEEPSEIDDDDYEYRSIHYVDAYIS
jgi:hypothetical protein